MAGPYSIGSDHWPGLSKLNEECGEVVQITGKLMGTGGSTTHWEGAPLDGRLLDEMADVAAAIDFVLAYNGLDVVLFHEIRMTKYQRFKQWHDEGDPPPDPHG